MAASRPSLTSWFVIACLLLHFALAVGRGLSKSVTYDEPAHLMAGLSYWHFNDYRLHPENGNLAQRLIALPVVLFATYELPSRDQAAWHESDVWALGDEFLHRLGNDRRHIVLLGRSSTGCLSMLLCLVVFLWSRQLFGTLGGCLSLLLAAFSPTLLAHGALMTSDTCQALFWLLALGSAWALMHRVDGRRIVLCGLSVAGLLLSKLSAIAFMPVAALMTASVLIARSPLEVALSSRRLRVERRSRRMMVLGGAALAVAFVAYAGVWSAYAFRYEAASEHGAQQRFHPFGSVAEAATHGGMAGSVIAAVDSHRLMPQAWSYGAAYVAAYVGGRYAFLNGEHSTSGWAHFFPYAVLVKTPLPLFAILALAAAAAIVGRRSRGAGDATKGETVRQPTRWWLPLAVSLIVLWPLYMSTNLNIGHRHVLTTYPMTFIFAGAAGHWLQARMRAAAAAVVACAALFVTDSVAIFPHHLSYFNPIVGPEHAWHHMVDSNLDWGQDLPALAQYLDAHDEDTVYLGYFGTADPASYSIDATLLPAAQLRPGVYCLSATFLQAVYDYDTVRGPWTRDLELAYRTTTDLIGRYHAMPPAELSRLLQQHDSGLEMTVAQFNRLRTARLLAYLRKREPKAMAGYSILIFDVTQADLQRALMGPVEALM